MEQVEIIAANRNNSSSTYGRSLKKVCVYARVSSDTEEQLNSYSSQIKHYSTMIQSNPDWIFAGIYADEGISGTQVKNRTQFQKMIKDCMEQKIDMIIAKSISRFARNTLDTLKYVRLLREYNVDVFFEKENIHTLELNSEMFLTLYSAFAQAESESTSNNVRMGYQAKMKRGEACGQINPFGYDYDPITKTISINEKEAEIVRKIFNYYINGMGTSVLVKQLEKEGIKSPKGKDKWSTSVIKGLLRNEKYIGDVCSQKYYVKDPMNHKEVRNRGEKPKYYVKNHHEPIIDKAVWDKAQKIYNSRSIHIKKGKEYCPKFSIRYPLSSKVICGQCHQTYIRHSHMHTNKDGNQNRYIYWKCKTSSSADSSHKTYTIREEEIEKLFVDLYNKLIAMNDYSHIFSKIIKIIDNIGKDSDKELQLEKKEDSVRQKISKLVDLKISNSISQELFEEKNKQLSDELHDLEKQKLELLDISKNKAKHKSKIERIKKELEKSKKANEFDEDVFKKLISKIQVGDYDEDGIYNPYLIRFFLNCKLNINYNRLSHENLFLEPNTRIC